MALNKIEKVLSFNHKEDTTMEEIIARIVRLSDEQFEHLIYLLQCQEDGKDGQAEYRPSSKHG